MAWNDIPGNKLITGADLISSPFPPSSGQTIPNNNRVLTRSQAQMYVNIDPIPNDNRGIKKNELVASYNNIGVPINAWHIANNSTHIFLSEPDRHRVLMYPIGGGLGVVIAGTGVAGDGTYQLNRPLGLFVQNGLLVIADSLNSRIVTCSASGTPGSNPLNTEFTTSQYGLYPVHVAAQIYPPSTGINSMWIARTVTDLTDTFNKQVRWVSKTGTVVDNKVLNSEIDRGPIQNSTVQFTDPGSFRVQYRDIQGAYFRYLTWRNTPETGRYNLQTTNDGSAFRYQAYLWIPWNTGNGTRRWFSIYNKSITIMSNTSLPNIPSNDYGTSVYPAAAGRIFAASFQMQVDYGTDPFDRPIFLLDENSRVWRYRRINGVTNVEELLVGQPVVSQPAFAHNLQWTNGSCEGIIGSENLYAGSDYTGYPFDAEGVSLFKDGPFLVENNGTYTPIDEFNRSQYLTLVGSGNQPNYGNYTDWLGYVIWEGVLYKVETRHWVPTNGVPEYYIGANTCVQDCLGLPEN